MNETAHTPTPWTVTRSKLETDGAFDYAISADGVLVLAETFGRDAKGGWPPSQANAEFIVRAVNAHDDLLMALKLLLSLCEAGGDPFDEPGRPTVARARAAISKATAPTA